MITGIQTNINRTLINKFGLAEKDNTVIAVDVNVNAAQTRWYRVLFQVFLLLEIFFSSSFSCLYYPSFSLHIISYVVIVCSPCGYGVRIQLPSYLRLVGVVKSDQGKYACNIYARESGLTSSKMGKYTILV